MKDSLFLWSKDTVWHPLAMMSSIAAIMADWFFDNMVAVIGLTFTAVIPVVFKIITMRQEMRHKERLFELEKLKIQLEITNLTPKQ